MTSIPTFSGDVSVFENEDMGLRIECSEKYVSGIIDYLRQNGFKYDNPIVAVPGSKNINSYMEFSVTVNSYDVLVSTVSEYLRNAGFNIVEEKSNFVGEKCVKFNLTNVSVFDR
jgi:hypothetical protein